MSEGIPHAPAKKGGMCILKMLLCEIMRIRSDTPIPQSAEIPA